MTVEPSYRGCSGAQGDVRYTPKDGSIFEKFMAEARCLDVSLHLGGYNNYDIPKE